MRNYFICVSLMALIVILVACSEQPKDVVDIYTAGINGFIEEDNALNADMAFIALDLTKVNDLTDEEVQSVKKFFEEKYKIDVKLATFAQLKEQGHFNEEIMRLDGILVEIESVKEKWNNDVVMAGSKYRSGLGAIGGECILQKKKREWNVKEFKMTWIS